LTPERCQGLRRGGAVACSLGVESAQPAGTAPDQQGNALGAAATAVRNLARAGIAAEVMCFSISTETLAEPLATLRLIERHAPYIAAFIVGRFELTHGSRVARDPTYFDCANLDRARRRAGTALFFAERKPARRGRERVRLERGAGATGVGLVAAQLSLGRLIVDRAQPIFYYDHFGSGVSGNLAGRSAQLQGKLPASQSLVSTCTNWPEPSNRRPRSGTR